MGVWNPLTGEPELFGQLHRPVTLGQRKVSVLQFIPPLPQSLRPSEEGLHHSHPLDREHPCFGRTQVHLVAWFEAANVNDTVHHRDVAHEVLEDTRPLRDLAVGPTANPRLGSHHGGLVERLELSRQSWGALLGPR
ncbi:hypothetical protein D3C71_1791110 [compost metagenome]